MRIAFLTANQAWAVIFGDGQVVDIDGRHLWSSCHDLVRALEAKGLGVDRRHNLFVIEGA